MIDKQKFFAYKNNIIFHNVALGSSNTLKEFLITTRMDSSSFLKLSQIILKQKLRHS